MYLTYNESKSIIAKRFIRTLKSNVSSFILIILTDQFMNIVILIIALFVRNLLMLTIVLPAEVESNNMVLKFSGDDKVMITTYKNILSKDFTENWSI